MNLPLLLNLAAVTSDLWTKYFNWFYEFNGRTINVGPLKYKKWSLAISKNEKSPLFVLGAQGYIFPGVKYLFSSDYIWMKDFIM